VGKNRKEKDVDREGKMGILIISVSLSYARTQNIGKSGLKSVPIKKSLVVESKSLRVCRRLLLLQSSRRAWETRGDSSVKRREERVLSEKSSRYHQEGE